MAGAYLSELPFRCSTLEGRLLALPTNIRLGCKGLIGTNALDFYENAYLMAVKSFITLATDRNKLERLSLADLSRLFVGKAGSLPHTGHLNGAAPT